MTSLHIIVVILVVIAGLVLAAECEGQPTSPSKSTINNTITLINTIQVISTPTQSVTITSPSLECPGKTTTTNSVMSGDPFVFSDTSIRPEGNIVRIWIFRDNFVTWLNSSVKSGILNNITLESGQTSQLKNGTYYLLFQYRENGSHFDIDMKNSNYPDQILNKNGVLILDLQRVRKGFVKGLEARTILEYAINTPGKDKQSENTTLNVTRAWIQTNPIGAQTIGRNFTISGTTNLPPGVTLLIQIYPTAFTPTNMDKRGWGPGYTYVKEGTCSINTWSLDYQGNVYDKTGEYNILVLKTLDDPSDMESYQVFNLVHS